MDISETQLVVGAAIIWQGTHLLCAERAYPPELAGQWELPGGKAEPGETPQQAIAREITEELGFLATPPTPFTKPTASNAVGLTNNAGSIIAIDRIFPGPLPDLSWPINHKLRLQVWLCAPLRLPGPAPEQRHDTVTVFVLPASSQVHSALPDGGPGSPSTISGLAGGLAGSDHRTISWVPWAKATSLPWLPADKPIINHLQATLR